ncbi:MAG: S9 family peptidase [Phycisphaerae bacterium]
MEKKTQRQFGLWDSPVTPATLGADVRLGDVRWDTDGKTLVWLEGRSGKGVLVCRRPGGDAPRDLTGDLSVRAEVGYGGGDFDVSGGFVYFLVDKTGRIYRQSLQTGPARPITPAFGKAGSPAVSPDGRFISYVHTDENVDRLAVVDAEGRHWPAILAGGSDFYMSPTWSPDGSLLAWIEYDHPNMPWNSTRCCLAEANSDGNGLPTLGEKRVLVDEEGVAVAQPQFSPDGKTLYCIDDRSGWPRLSAVDLSTGSIRPLSEDGKDAGIPGWSHGSRTYTVCEDGTLFCRLLSEGVGSLVRIDSESASSEPVADLGCYTQFTQPAAASQGPLAVRVSSPTTPARIVVLDGPSSRIVARTSGEVLSEDALSECRPLSWESFDGETAYGLYYPPASEEFTAEGKPPVIVWVHGGPTSAVEAAWHPYAQYFASRGYAVLMVNYRGSTGYGKEYMNKLRGMWGVYDVEDSIYGVRYLDREGLGDADKAVVMGGSAGGFTVLHSMVSQPDAFAAGICLFGVSNQFTLASQTHKFESRYLDSILGPLPEAAALYRERSPLFHAERIVRPIAIFQGDIDRIVPRKQADSVVKALERTGTPHIYHVYEGEGHGWRRKDTIEHFFNACEEFLREHVIFA